MKKKALMKNLARTAYNVGFGAKKHFLTYDIYRILPRFISLATTLIGVYQLSIWYENIKDETGKDLLSVSLIVVGIIGLVLDLLSSSKEQYNHVGKQMIKYYNELSDMYAIVETKNESDSSLEDIEVRRKQIQQEVDNCSLSNQAIFTHWFTHFGFFKTMQSDWVVKELNLGKFEKYPFFHFETLIGISILIAIIICIR
jgi:hypothetical protein